MNPELSDAEYFPAIRTLMGDVETVLQYLDDAGKERLEEGVRKARGNIAGIKIAIARACNGIAQSDGHPPISFHAYGEVEGVAF